MYGCQIGWNWLSMGITLAGMDKCVFTLTLEALCEEQLSSME